MPAVSRLVHLKDYRIGEMPIPEGGVDFTSKEGMMKFMSNFTNIVQFAEVGEGTLDMPAIIQAGLEGGGEYFLVEQDDCYGRDPFDSLKDQPRQPGQDGLRRLVLIEKFLRSRFLRSDKMKSMLFCGNAEQHRFFMFQGSAL